MRSHRRDAARKWARAALKCGLLLTDTNLWTSIGEQLRDRVSDVRDEMQRRYEDTADRLHEAHDALHGRKNHWLTHTASFVGGVGIGVGLGVLLAPVSGEEARAAVRDRVVDFKNKVTNAAAATTGIRRSAMESRA
jgi:gas vesicle protein